MNKMIENVIREINDIYELEQNSELVDELIDQAHQEVVDELCLEGSYHFWVELDGFIECDVTKQELKRDMSRLDCEDEECFYEKLNDNFIVKYQKIAKENKNK